MHITNHLQLSAGMEIYEVCSFGCGIGKVCSLYKFKVIEVPVPPQHGVTQGTNPQSHNYVKLETLDHKQLTTGGVWDTYAHLKVGAIQVSSMKDMGIIPNTYNKHQVFTSLAEAKLYGEGKLSLDEIDEAPPAKTEEPCDYDRAMKVVSW